MNNNWKRVDKMLVEVGKDDNLAPTEKGSNASGITILFLCKMQDMSHVSEGASVSEKKIKKIQN